MNSVDLLKKQGYRLTKPRQELLKVLGNYPQTVQEIFNSLKQKHISVDLASVYRSLELFVNMGIVHVVDTGEDKKRYELVDDTRHHHHLICTNCKSIEDVTLPENDFTQKLELKSRFKIDHHHLEFFGLCRNCQ